MPAIPKSFVEKAQNLIQEIRTGANARMNQKAYDEQVKILAVDLFKLATLANSIVSHLKGTYEAHVIYLPSVHSFTIEVTDGEATLVSTHLHVSDIDGDDDFHKHEPKVYDDPDDEPSFKVTVDDKIYFPKEFYTITVGDEYYHQMQFKPSRLWNGVEVTLKDMKITPKCTTIELV